MRRIFRAVDVKFLMALTALIVSATICWGFIQRGARLAEAAEARSGLSSQVAEVSADNRRLQRQLSRIGERASREERRADRDVRQASDEREVLLREFVRLNRWLRENGIVIPEAVTRAPSSPAPSHRSKGGNGGGQSQANGGGGKPDRPGNAPAHSNAGGNNNGNGKPGRKP